MTEAAERANDEKVQFLAMLAHELRNPLAPILNALAVLRRVTSTEPTLPWVHDVVKRQVDHMTRLLNDLLEVSRVTSGKIALQKRSITVSEFMLHAIETCRPLMHDRDQNFTIAIPPQPLTIDGDPTRLAQIFSNLLNNAAKYTPIRGSISFSAQQQDEKVVLRVKDDGCGIATEALPRIFELFTQEGRSLARAQGGLGIGLTVVRRLVQLHGGTIEASSPGLDQGSEFVVTIPLIRNLPAGPVRDGKEEVESRGSTFRIALIEDNVDASESMKAVLQMMGHEVSTAFDGDAGYALIRDGHHQIVLCDIGLPGMDGYQIVARLRSEMSPPFPVMIALTGYGSPEDRMRALESGFDHHLTKPVEVEALLRLIAAQEERVLPNLP